jgi:exodeoxyribonuclease-3
MMGRAQEQGPMSLRITTWNVNSVRPRLAGLERLVRAVGPDVLCLQETKVQNERFPVSDLEALGFRHHALHGQAGYHGVAVFSKLPLEDALPIAWCGKDDCRHLRVRLPGELELHNLYVPAGGRIPDPEINPKFRHKLEFLAALSDCFRTGFDPARRALLVGDLNVAPLPTDVWNHKALLRVVTHTPGEVAALARLQAAHRWVDAVRRIIPPARRLFTWWSYLSPDWRASDRGRRLDHAWITPNLLQRLRAAAVLRAARSWPQPSDHVPVTIVLDEG